MSKLNKLTLGILKPSLCTSQTHVQEVLRIIKSSSLEIVRSKKIFWKPSEAEKFYAEHKGKFYFPRLVQHATSGPFLALSLYSPNDDAIKLWRTLIGPTHVYKAQWTTPDCLRAKYGLSDTRNGFHGSDSPESVQKETEQIFEGFDMKWYIEHRESEK